VTNLSGGSGSDALTIREGTKLYGQSILMDQIVGNPQQVADQLIAIWDETGCDEFLATSTYTPGSFTEFSDMVVPVLQKYGVSRRRYTGKTLRENMRLPGSQARDVSIHRGLS